MNEEIEIREKLEIRIVALLLGEASAFETAELEEAMQTISSKRPVVDFAEVYINSVERFLQQQVKAAN